MNELTHPAIIERLKQGLDEMRREGKHPVAIVVAPLLFEAGLKAWFDKVIVVWASEREQIRRLMARDNLQEDDAWLRIRAQMPLESKKAMADWVIDTEAGPEALQRQVEQIWREISQAPA